MDSTYNPVGELRITGIAWCRGRPSRQPDRRTGAGLSQDGRCCWLTSMLRWVRVPRADPPAERWRSWKRRARKSSPASRSIPQVGPPVAAAEPDGDANAIQSLSADDEVAEGAGRKRWRCSPDAMGSIAPVTAVQGPVI